MVIHGRESSMSAGAWCLMLESGEHGTMILSSFSPVRSVQDPNPLNDATPLRIGLSNSFNPT